MNIVKFFLSLSLTIVMLLLMDPRSFYGLAFHEWAGLIIGLFFILHKILNWGWIKKVTLGFVKNVREGQDSIIYWMWCCLPELLL